MRHEDLHPHRRHRARPRIAGRHPRAQGPSSHRGIRHGGRAEQPPRACSATWPDRTTMSAHRQVQNNLFAIGSRLASSSEEEADPLQGADDHRRGYRGPGAGHGRHGRGASSPCATSSFPEVIPAVSQAHICRTVCRRAERRVVHLAAHEPCPEIVVRYLNRLSRPALRDRPAPRQDCTAWPTCPGPPKA